MDSANAHFITHLTLGHHRPGHDDCPPAFKNEQNAALEGILAQNRFHPANAAGGPYKVCLAIEEHRMTIDIRMQDDAPVTMLLLSLKPYRRLIKDYFLMIDSYEQARRHASREKLEAIDMGRRGIHNEGATLLQTRLEDKVKIDFETARRLFTLICSLTGNDVRMIA